MNKPTTVNFFRAIEEFRNEARTMDAVPLVSALILLHAVDRFPEHFAALGLSLPQSASHELQQSLQLAPGRVEKLLHEVLMDRVDSRVEVDTGLGLKDVVVARASRAVAQEIWQATSGLAAEAGIKVLGTAFSQMLDYIVRQFPKSSGFMQTPETVAQLMAELVDAGPGMSVLDVTSGFSRTLVEVARLQRRRGEDPNSLRYVGQERDPLAALLGAVQLVLNGVTQFTLHVDDVLTDPRTGQGEFDRVIADPPLGLTLPHLVGRLEGDPRFVFGKKGLPRAADWLFLQHGLTALKPGGRAVFITAHGPMFRGGMEASVRQDLLAAGWLHTVMALPSSLYPNTGIPMVLTVFDRPAPGQTGFPDVLMIDASPMGTRQGRSQILDEATRSHLLTLVRQRSEDPERSALVPHARIHDNDDAWQPNQYLSQDSEDSARSLVQIRAELSGQLVTLRSAEQQLEDALSALTPPQR
ncbi:hypothetical protein GCM10010840_33840 [Deinococcus aerolatus]|uniref:site-specific DNA-methyltransferase (adenine-specific) n=1 Tax=Deinococcus aerolatus TaxID=522487 RepID=A0ABQ2GFL2_9DEIO|nr:N-6 DNA methylase [Deinococcus aerolatus]GGL92991.1 hypothetical protein GCM10010840_33840 [Deinococcus aerolatus]